MKFITQTLSSVCLCLLFSAPCLAQTAPPPPPLPLGAAATLASTPFGKASLPAAIVPPATSKPSAASADPLDPEVAFQLSASAQTDRVNVVFEIAQGYYLYAEKIAVSVKPPAVLGALNLPKGERHFDATFNKTLDTYRQKLTFSVPLSQVSAGQTVQLMVQSQGCADIGICYPPQTQLLNLTVTPGGANAKAPALIAAAAGGAGVANAVGTSSAASNSVANGASSTAAASSSAFSPVAALAQTGGLAYLKLVVVFMGLGLLLAFTPCVLPMLPIVSAIVLGGAAGQAGQLGRWRGLALSATYVLGMALVYTALGVGAGLAGQGLAAALQTPWVIGSFALLMVVLAGAQFGWYTLQLPQSWMNQLNQTGGQASPRGAFAGAAVMGALSGLMVGPCLTAPLAAALAFIAQTGQAVKGGAALFSLALGMGLPLLLIGAGGAALLPKAGAWMERVKHGFGWGLLATALWMAQPFLPPMVGALGWAGLLLSGGIALGALESAAYGWARVAKALGLAAALWGAAVIWGAAGGQFDALQPLKPSASTVGAAPAGNAPKLAFEPIASPQALAARLAVARAAGQPILLDFYADWCVSCVEMERFTFSDSAVQQALQGFALLKVDVTQNTANDAALMKQFGIFGPPSTVFFNALGQEQTAARVAGFMPAAAFAAHVKALLPATGAK